jgi:hypothetical protein
MSTWFRPTATSFNYHVGHSLLAQIPVGGTLLRVHLRWGIVADTSIDVDYSSVYQNIITMGIVTTIGPGTEGVPDPRLQAGDVQPPTQRWVYWETRAPKPVNLDASTGSIAWVDTGATEDTTTKGQVLATGIGAGQFLNVWASWSSPFAWDPTGTAMVWLGASVLVK